MTLSSCASLWATISYLTCQPLRFERYDPSIIVNCESKYLYFFTAKGFLQFCCLIMHNGYVLLISMHIVLHVISTSTLIYTLSVSWEAERWWKERFRGGIFWTSLIIVRSVRIEQSKLISCFCWLSSVLTFRLDVNNLFTGVQWENALLELVLHAEIYRSNTAWWVLEFLVLRIVSRYI